MMRGTEKGTDPQWAQEGEEERWDVWLLVRGPKGGMWEGEEVFCCCKSCLPGLTGAGSGTVIDAQAQAGQVSPPTS
jgi:hypothetical protein